ncbi:MAG: LLM class F420-dependent oxidoreductase [Gammaproteobacteria bacterium]|nr:LLM class F420-dependent oxidoreductase [Gammaproteobacteria bacterium]
MKTGVFSFNTDYGMRADKLARALEDRGYDSLWVGEHTHIPADRRSPYPGGGELPRPYYHMVDPFVSLASAASVTSSLKLATGICLVIERDPITLAKEVASLDHLSEGRFLFGIGGGWNAEEMENHAVDFSRRWKVLRERVEAMKAIWTEEEASYQGEFAQFDRIISFPKPVQRPHPPIIYGGATKQGLKRIARYCDGWLPFDVMGDKLVSMHAQLKCELEAVGRSADDVAVSVFCFGAPSPSDMERYRAINAERVVLVAPRAEVETMKFLDENAPR